jgi:signal peptidase I
VDSALDEPVEPGDPAGRGAANADAAPDDQDENDDIEETDEADRAEPSEMRSRLRTVLEWVAIFGGALLVAFLVRQTSAQAFYIPSESMEPTLHKGDRILVNKWSYRLHDVNRGDVVVFERPENAASLNPQDDIPDLIKRVVGLPGDTVEGRDGSVYVNGKRLVEPYLPATTRTDTFEPIDVPEGEVFVMGDNRGNSTDSRAFGPIDEGLIVGRAFIRIYPLDDIGGL